MSSHWHNNTSERARCDMCAVDERACGRLIMANCCQLAKLGPQSPLRANLTITSAWSPNVRPACNMTGMISLSWLLLDDLGPAAVTVLLY